MSVCKRESQDGLFNKSIKTNISPELYQIKIQYWSTMNGTRNTCLQFNLLSLNYIFICPLFLQHYFFIIINHLLVHTHNIICLNWSSKSNKKKLSTEKKIQTNFIHNSIKHKFSVIKVDAFDVFPYYIICKCSYKVYTSNEYMYKKIKKNKRHIVDIHF